MAAEAGKIVIVAALDGTFERKPFGRIYELFSEAESIDKLTAVCKNCGLDASFSRRLSASKETVAIGGADMVCLIQHRRSGKLLQFLHSFLGIRILALGIDTHVLNVRIYLYFQPYQMLNPQAALFTLMPPKLCSTFPFVGNVFLLRSCHRRAQNLQTPWS